MQQQEWQNEYQSGWCIDYMWYEIQLKKNFPDANPVKAWYLVRDAIAPIEKRVLNEFKNSDEYKWWLTLKRYLDLEDEKQWKNAQKEYERERERERENQRKKAEEEARRQYEEYSRRNTSTDSSKRSIVTLSPEEAQLIKDLQ